ncbi:unnamed protein product [Owenia fusiformis]|uniref:Alpha-1,3-mannosyl-glycoprotein 2-beta-N-acetylglucosaminyltransferase n=1 Tax=Owenia fusiformis TaxID=6347 RepID=A0A8J1UYP6_OWEFU|nr:unnamed protein product [Owenia fusiformis]
MVKRFKIVCMLVAVMSSVQLMLFVNIQKGNVDRAILQFDSLIGDLPKKLSLPREQFQDGGSLCVAILTGAPSGERKKSAPRLLRNLIEFAEIPTENIHVFYENIDPMDLSYDLKRLEILLNPATKPNSISNIGIPKINAHKINYTGLPYKLKKHRLITFNYKFMLDRIFKDLRYNYCTILEDDLILSMDAADYLKAGMKLMEKDSTIMSVSLFNDNSFSWCASNDTFFHRVEHFGGLGFLMSGRHYVGKISSKLNTEVPALPWDETFQRELGRYKMVTIFPELSRSLHVENQEINVPSDLRIPRDDTEAISMYNGPRIQHILDTLGESDYDEFITQFVRGAYKIEHIEDVAFFSHSQDKRVLNFVFPNCDSPEELNSMMVARGLVGFGNGGIVRGAYKDTIFLRPFGNQVLIVCKPSIWHGVASTAPSATDLIRTFVNGITLKRLERTMGRPKMGILYSLENNEFQIRKGKSGQSCFDVCAANNEVCDRIGISMLDTNCGVLRALSSDYNNCKESPLTIYKSLEFYLPAMDPDGDWLISRKIPSFYFYNCYAANSEFSRICACK